MPTATKKLRGVAKKDTDNLLPNPTEAVNDSTSDVHELGDLYTDEELLAFNIPQLVDDYHVQHALSKREEAEKDKQAKVLKKISKSLKEKVLRGNESIATISRANEMKVLFGVGDLPHYKKALGVSFEKIIKFSVTQAHAKDFAEVFGNKIVIEPGKKYSIRMKKR